MVDWQSASDLDSIRNSCDVCFYKTWHFLDLLTPGGGWQICPPAFSFFPKILLFEKKFCSYISALIGNFGPIGKGPPLWKLGVSDQLSDPPNKRKVFDHEKWFLMYLTYI